MDIGKNISLFELQPAELELVKLGMSDAVMHSQPQVDLDTMRPKLMDGAQARPGEDRVREAERESRRG